MGLTFVRRPVLSAVLSIALVLLGIIALQVIPMGLFPSVAPPEVNVTVEYTGANAETVTNAALMPLERAINGVPGMKYMSSDAGNDGVGVVQILFEIGTDPDVAAVNVQNRVSSVVGELPPEVTRNGVKIAREENAMLLYLSLSSEDEAHDEKFLYNFADINLLAELKRIPGVGFADIMGAKEYAIRVWLRPDRMAHYGVSAEEVLEALDAANVEAAPGKIGENSDIGSAQLQYTLKYTGKFSTVEDYARIPLRASPTGELVRVGDVADVELGTTYFDVEARLDGRPAASILLKQAPGSNAAEVIAGVKARMAELERDRFLPGMSVAYSFDVSRFLDAAVHEVQKTLLEAFVLVALVVFLFLADLRALLISVVAVPVSLIGTVLVLQLLGYSLNLITLFALVLAIGIVVDNAIVVVEAVHARMSEEHLSGREATERSIPQIAPAIVAITLVMASVFIPLAFIDGPAGIFYRQFSVTMAVAIGLSAVVALTLTPALCAALLQPHAGTEAPGRLGRFLVAFNAGYLRLELRFRALVGRLAPRRGATWALLGAFTLGAALLGRSIPTGFIPAEDQGLFYVSITTPPGATLERTKEVVNAVVAAARALPEVEGVASLAGTNVLSDGTGATYGTAIVNLRPWAERDRGVTDVLDDLQQQLSGLQGADIELFLPPSVPGYGNASGFELRLLDQTGAGDLQALERVVTDFVAELRARPEVGSAFTIFNASYPQYTLRLDLDRAARSGVPPARALGALQTLLGSEYATNFIRFGKMYKVMVQARPEHRAAPEQLLRLQVRADSGALVPMSAFLDLEKSYGVDQLTRYNMYPSAEINGEGAPGLSSGAVLAAVQRAAAERLPQGYSIDWAGISRDEVSAGNQGLIVGLIALVFVYLVLAAQYESFVLPAAVLLSLPPGLFGALLLLSLAGLENNIYTHLALVVLIGLLGKNAVLIVEFAELRCRAGDDPLAAVLHSVRLRLRPILMTSLAFVAGLVPLALATGAGAVANRTIGTATVGGMVFGTTFGALLVPGLYLSCKRLSAGGAR